MSGLSTEPRSVRGDDQYQDLELKDLDPEFARPAPLDSGAGAAGKYDGVPPPRRRGVIGTLERGMDLLVRYGVEERGIQPRPEEERERLSAWSYLPQWTLWAALNTNILTFSAGMLGPSLFGLDFRASVLCIVFFGAASSVPPAFLACNGPKLGMRQMVQARYAFGYYLALVFGLINCTSFVMFLSLTVILGGQCLSLASNSDMSWTVGIVIVAIIALILSFVGLRALHILSIASFPIILVLYAVLVGVMGDKLHLVYSDALATVVDVTPSGVLAFGATLIGFTVSYCSLASDFTTTLPSHTPRGTLFLVIWTGLFIPIMLIQILGAAAQLVAFSFPDWETASFVGVPNLIYEITGSAGAARFVMVLFCFSVIANTAPTIYSCGLSAQVAIPWLVRVPRYFLAFVVSAVYLPVAIAGSTHFYTVLSNFSSVLGYWQAIFIPPMILEAVIFRAPVSTKTYPIDAWDQPSKLPIGISAIVAGCCGIPLIAACMAQAWWVGWIAQMIPGGEGDIAFELTFAVVTILYVPLRYLERKRTGR